MGRVSQERNTSLELLRILAIVGVMTLHYNNISNESIVEGSIAQYYLMLTNCLSICAVNVFVLISAFFLCATNKRKISKILELIIQFVLFRVGNYIISIVVSKSGFSLNTFINIILPVNYFIVLYSVLYIISPYINVLINELSYKRFKKLTVLLVCLFSLETWLVDILYRVSDKPYDGLSTVGLMGSQNGFTIVNFVLLYFIGAYIRKNFEKINEIKYTNVIGLLIIILLVMYTMIIIENWLGMDLAVLNYNNPFVIVYAVLIVVLFMKLCIESKIINEFAKASFTCFIIHGNLLPFVGIERAVESSFGVLVLHQVVAITGIFVGSYVIYKIYVCCTNRIFKWIYKQVPKLDSYIDIV